MLALYSQRNPEPVWRPQGRERGTEQGRRRIPLIFHQENVGRWVEKVKLGRSWEPLDTGHFNDTAQASAEQEGTGHDQILGVF